MLQNLLIGRFGLKFHKETVESKTYELLIGPRGHKLQASTEEEVARTINVPKNPKALMEATVKETGIAPTPGGPIRLRLQAYTCRRGRCTVAVPCRIARITSHGQDGTDRRV